MRLCLECWRAEKTERVFSAICETKMINYDKDDLIEHLRDQIEDLRESKKNRLLLSITLGTALLVAAAIAVVAAIKALADIATIFIAFVFVVGISALVHNVMAAIQYMTID